MNATINCPSCGHSIELSETLAAPFVEAVKANMSQQLEAAQGDALAARKTLSETLAQIQIERAEIQTKITEGITAKRTELEAQLRKQIKAQLASDVASELEAKDERIKELRSKIESAKVAEAAALKAQQAAEDKAAEVEVEILQRLGQERDRLKKEAKEQAEDAMRLQIEQLRKQLNDTNAKLVEAQRKAEQGSQQLQGEVAELDLQSALCQSFPWDEIQEVKKGQRGADWIQHVFAGPGLKSGSILWESKRAQNWGGDWCEKVKQDARNCGAGVPVIVSEVLPNDIELFDQCDGVWVTKPSCAIAMAIALRHGLIEAATARKVGEGRSDKASLAYDYLTGPEFHARIMGIAESFQLLQHDLIREKNATTTRWNRREKLMNRVLESAMGMMGDLQGLAGNDLAELDDMTTRALGTGDEELED